MAATNVDTGEENEGVTPEPAVDADIVITESEGSVVLKYTPEMPDSP